MALSTPVFPRISKRHKGQSTVELALMLPILVILLMFIFKGFSLNDRASQQQVIDYQAKLQKFDHGNGSIELGYGELPGRQLVDLADFAPGADVGDTLLNVGTNLALDLGLNAAFSKMSFFQNDTFISGAAKGALTESSHQLVNSNQSFSFTDILWSAGTGGLSSGQSTEFFQGKAYKSKSWQELGGSSLQYAAIGFTNSKGSLQGAALGAVSGINNSDTLASFQGKAFEPLVGAAKGALQATVSGALSGQLSAKTVFISSGLGAYNTKTVAKTLPFTKWGKEGDPRQSALFHASSSALSTWASGGDAKTVVSSSVTGALGSQQFSQYSKEKWGGSKLGQEISSVSKGALGGFIPTKKSVISPKFEQGLIKTITQAGSIQKINSHMQNNATAQQATQELQQRLVSPSFNNDVLAIAAAALVQQVLKKEETP